MSILIPVSLGELVDKITILTIKLERIVDDQKLKLVKEELSLLQQTLDNYPRSVDQVYIDNLYEVNIKLWDIEDCLREYERERRFDDDFIACARKVYFLNDHRFRIKDAINQFFSNGIREVKSYEDY